MTTIKEQLQETLQAQIEILQELINDNIKSTGNTEEECQQLTLLNALSNFEYAVNGIEEEDLITD